ncbi:MAG: chemotaxis protein [Gracilibacter sp. BRH_c7a]|nr:MAG: chemotaxis protein [Gracilibacter sp. BRH_c7a]
MAEVKISNATNKQAINSIIAIAKEFETVLEQHDGDWQEAIRPLREVIDRAIGDNEFLCLYDLDGLSLVHSNRLREGIYFNNETELRGARCKEPITQIYHRNTGEVLLDAASPIKILGQHRYGIRMGIPIRKKRLSTRFILLLLPVIFLAAGWLGSSSFSAIAILFSIPTIAVTLFLSYYEHSKITTSLNEAFKVTKSLSKGDLRALAEAKSEDELGALSYEVNKVSMGMKNMIENLNSASQQTKDISQSQVEYTKRIVEYYEELSELFQEFNSGASKQIEGMQRAKDQVNIIHTASQNINNRTKEVLNLTTSAKETSEEGRDSVIKAVNEMEMVFRVSEQVNRSILELAQEAEKISEIVELINGISEQTNLLALNAAIEAARAGEHGRGFAVVAEEVRKLADNSLNSASNIMELINNVKIMVQGVVENMEQGMGQVTNGKDVIEKAGKAISYLDEVIRTTSVKVEENFENANSLLEQCNVLSVVQEDATDIAFNFSKEASEAAKSIGEQMHFTQEVAASADELAINSENLDKILKRYVW